MDETREKWLARLKRPLARVKQGKQDDWYRLQAKAGEPAKLYIYDEIGYFGQTAKGLATDLAEAGADEVEVHLNSPGGDVFDGLAIYQALKDHPATVTVHIDGLAASIASVIAQAGDKIVMAPKASMMIHDGWTMACGNAGDLRKTAELLDKQSSIIASVYADRTGQPLDFWRDRMLDETWYSAEEALAAGLVDEIEGQPKKVEDAFDLTVFAHAGRDDAPAPLTKPLAAKAVEDEPVTEPPATDPKKDEVPAFVWDFGTFQSALKEGLK